jgi:hypothetical protein
LLPSCHFTSSSLFVPGFSATLWSLHFLYLSDCIFQKHQYCKQVAHYLNILYIKVWRLNLISYSSLFSHFLFHTLQINNSSTVCMWCFHGD